MNQRIRIRNRFHNISLINVRTPIEEKEEDKKDAFYDILERTYDNCPQNNMKIIIGDLNAKIGRDFHVRQIGRHSMHMENNENDLRIINFTVEKNMIVGSTCF